MTYKINQPYWHIVDILIEHCGVAANRRKTIVEELSPQYIHFKDHQDLGVIFIQTQLVKVNCYSEDRTTRINLMMQTANSKLTELYNKYAVSNKVS